MNGLENADGREDEDDDAPNPWKFHREDALCLALIAAAFGASAWAYDDLPARMPVHFDIQGKPNGWMAREYGAYFLPTFAVVLGGILRAVSGVPAAMRIFMAITLSVTQLVLLRIATGDQAAPPTLFPVLLGVMWIALGQILPKLKQNRWAGVRTGPTMRSPEVWAMTQRFASKTFTVGGVISLLGGLYGRPASIALALVALVTSALLPVISSYFAQRNPTP